MVRRDRCLIIIKAQPHRSSRYFETVCCAGIGCDGKWRRQYPVPFRILDPKQQFTRWSWISYDFISPRDDRRRESQKVVPESIVLESIRMKEHERSRVIGPLVHTEFREADARQESLTLIRPQEIQFSWEQKTSAEINDERLKHERLANQLSFWDKTARPLKPPPYKFFVRWRDPAGAMRRHESDDWESVGAFFNFRKSYGEAEALIRLRDNYEDKYMKAGLVLAFSTHSRRNAAHGMQNQWLLVGLIRLDETLQPDLFLGQSVDYFQ